MTFITFQAIRQLIFQPGAKFIKLSNLELVDSRRGNFFPNGIGREKVYLLRPANSDNPFDISKNSKSDKI